MLQNIEYWIITHSPELPYRGIQAHWKQVTLQTHGKIASIQSESTYTPAAGF